jgi:23S rRNA (pseudouridine1915-N3)-methyltransferase
VSRELHILWAGRHQRGPWQTLCEDYRKRIARHVPVHDRPVKVKLSGDDDNRRSAEGEKLLATAPDPSWIISLDSRGKCRSSEDLAELMTQIRHDWPHPVAFLIGSDLGLAPEVLESSRAVISFGPMTLGHELARLVLYEQIYRALSIQLGINYHRRQL